ncbi:hypothetical protein LSAT2_013210 [Lamellibrachia satsuma]|nr:hypothetical protein LSAT2_013210 [Lamellibrachia satsuma]
MIHAFILVQTKENTDQLRQDATVLRAHELQLEQARTAQKDMTGDLQATREKVETVEVQTKENTDQLRQDATVLRAHELQFEQARTAQKDMTGDLQATREKVETVEEDLHATKEQVEAMEVQTQENRDELRQQVTVLRAYEQQLQDARTAQENIKGSKCRLWICSVGFMSVQAPSVGLLSVVVLLIAVFLQWNECLFVVESMCHLWTCCVGLLSVVVLLIAVFLQWNVCLFLVGSKCHLWTCCVGLLSVVLLLIAVFLQWNGQLVMNDGCLQDHDRCEVQMTTKVLLDFGTIIAVLVIVTTVWWMCYQRKGNEAY